MAEQIVVDIRTRFLRDDQRCYILFPGTGYRYYQYMRDNEVVFLDLPGFPWSPGENLATAKDMIERTVVSERIAEWHRKDRPQDDLPARKVEDVKGFRRTAARAQFAGLVKGFFSSIKPGDVVIVPAPTYEGDVLFGEVVGNGDPVEAKVPAYPGDSVLARSVRWIARVPRSQIPSWLERKIPSPNPLRQIENTYFDDIFDIMYERYYYRDKFVCKFNVKSQEFSSLDNFLFQQIVLYAAALHENNQEGNISDIANKAISVVVSELNFSEDIPDQRIYINSPGHIVVYSKNIIPLVAGVFMALAVLTVSTPGIAAAEIVIENSVDNTQISKECVSDIKQEVDDDMKAMGYQRWQELCTIEAQARKRTEISSGIDARSSGVAPKQDRVH